MKRYRLPAKIAATVLLTVLVFGIMSPVLTDANAAGPAEAPSPNIGNTFPSIHVNIKMSDIDREKWQGVTVSLDNTAEEYIIDGAEADIRGRGNTTWLLDKKPFRIRFKQARTMLDAGHEARIWTFLADHSDKSLMRNYSAYRLASNLGGMYTAPYGRHVNVYMDGEYQGVYLMSTQVSEIAEGRVNLTYNTNPALCEYLIEMDARAPDGGTEDVDYVTVGGNHYAISYPADDRLTASHVRYVKNYLSNVDGKIAVRDNSVFPLIDLQSFVDFYIVQELYKNADAGFSSVFMQIRGQGESRRLEMGPVWDFDVSSGNSVHIDYSPTGLWVAEVNTWYKELSNMPVFYDALASRWNAVSEAQIRETITNIKSTARKYQNAYKRNFSLRWDVFDMLILYNPPEMGNIKSHLGQVDYLTGFLESRKRWLDEYFNKTKPSWASIKADDTTGWLQWGDKWYLFDSDGGPVSGWVDYNGKWYYLYSDGMMATGWLQNNGKQYYADSDGDITVGWLLEDSNWYYFHSDGVMAKNETVTINEKDYSFGENGIWISQ